MGRRSLADLRLAGDELVITTTTEPRLDRVLEVPGVLGADLVQTALERTSAQDLISLDRYSRSHESGLGPDEFDPSFLDESEWDLNDLDESDAASSMPAAFQGAERNGRSSPDGTLTQLGATT